MQICQVMTFLATVGLSLVLKPGMFNWIFFSFLIVGVFSSAATPFLLELAAEVREQAQSSAQPRSQQRPTSFSVPIVSTFPSQRHGSLFLCPCHSPRCVNSLSCCSSPAMLRADAPLRLTKTNCNRHPVVCAQVTYPAPESLSAGMCFMVYGLATFGFVQLSQVFM